MTAYALPILGLFVSSIIFWYKGNARQVYGLEWSPFTWWITTSLLTSYMSLYAWWKLVEIGDVWKAGVIWGLISVTVDLALNSYYFGFHWKGIVAILLCAIGAAIVHN
jgi:hypothetical protein